VVNHVKISSAHPREVRIGFGQRKSCRHLQGNAAKCKGKGFGEEKKKKKKKKEENNLQTGIREKVGRSGQMPTKLIKEKKHAPAKKWKRFRSSTAEKHRNDEREEIGSEGKEKGGG